MPELTVSMPAYNTGQYIREAIESVLCQEDVNFELIVVDDDSQDDTVEIVQSFKDKRLKLIRNPENRGIGYCHNVVINQSNSPFIIHVDSDDLVLPGAFKKMLDKIKSDPNIGQVHCYYFYIDEAGKVTKEAFRNNWRRFRANKRPGMDYKRQLLVHGTVINHLRTYRRKVLETVGKFNEVITHGEDYEMALRIVDKYDIRLVPEFLYCVRNHQHRTTAPIPFKSFVFWFRRLHIVRQLLKKKKIRFAREKKYKLSRLMSLGLLHTLRLPKLAAFIKKSFALVPLRIRRFLLEDLLSELYFSLIPHLDWWPIDLLTLKKITHVHQENYIAYYKWRFPTLSETFIQREIRALQQSGLSLKIFADISGDLDCLDENVKSLIKHSQYITPLNKKRLSRYKKFFFVKHPFSCLNLFLYVVSHRYGYYKTFQEDISVFKKAVYLAGTLKDHRITHIHCPWADRCAFIALIASKLLDIPLTVQARAYDIHRKKHQYALPEKFENAQLVITNSRYNESFIKSTLTNPSSAQVHVIYEGLDMEQFVPNPMRKDISKKAKLLSVARLIEEKGLIYLLKACKMLKDEGYAVHCDIIGAPQEPLNTNYYLALKKLHKKLHLEDCVFFLGVQPFSQVLEAYNTHDIFILPCVIAQNGGRDITPNVLLEAMAMKLPVISTTLSAIPEIVEDGVSGLLVPPNDENALADALIRLIKDEHLRKGLGENARKRIEERFDINKNIAHYLDVFKETRK